MNDPTKHTVLERVEAAMGRLFEGESAEVLEPTGAAPVLAQSSDARITTAIVSIERVGNHAYAHGASMGAAGALLRDPLWNAILRTLMPAQHAEAVGLAETRQLIPFLENNPVMAAYGTARYLEAAGQPRHQADPFVTRALPMEWDVWLDPHAPADLSRCHIAHGAKVTTIEQHLFGHSHIGLEMPDVSASATARNWLNLFGRAIAIYRAADLPDPSAAEPDDEAAAIHIASAFLRAPSGIVLDCKSTYSTPGDLNAFIVALKEEHDIDVIGVGTFAHQQLDGLVAWARRIKFFHGAHGVVREAREGGRVCQGDRLMFNAGSLLRVHKAHERAAETYSLDEDLLARLAEARDRLGLAIGLYVQEVAAAPHAVSLVVQLVNERPDIFIDGFAYGHVPGEAEAHVEGTGLGAQATPAMLEADGL